MPYDTGEHKPITSRWASLLTLPVLLVIGLILYELTEQPALGVAAICVKFGWEDFRTAFWLRRTDPHWRRGKALFWLYLASGLWKMAITASLMIFAYILLNMMGALGQGAGRQVAGAMLTAFAGIVLATVTACWAVVLALAWRIKCWLNSGVHYARRKNVWPPPVGWCGANNATGMLLGTSLFAALVPMLFVSLALLVNQVLGAPPRGPLGLMVMGSFPLLCLLLVLGLAWIVRRVLRPRIFAATPAECWRAPAIVEKKPPEPTYVGDEVEASRAGSWNA
jgi:hypothetical protein